MPVALAVAVLLVSTLALIALDRRPGSTPPAAVSSMPFAEALTEARRIRAQVGRELAKVHADLARQAVVARRRLRSTVRKTEADIPAP